MKNQVLSVDEIKEATKQLRSKDSNAIMSIIKSENDELLKLAIKYIKEDAILFRSLLSNLTPSIIDFAIGYYVKKSEKFAVFRILKNPSINLAQVLRILDYVTLESLKIFGGYMNTSFIEINPDFTFALTKKFEELGYTEWQHNNRIQGNLCTGTLLELMVNQLDDSKKSKDVITEILNDYGFKQRFKIFHTNRQKDYNDFKNFILYVLLAEKVDFQVESLSEFNKNWEIEIR